MDARRESEAGMTSRTTVEKAGELELVITRTFDAPARLVFQAWTTPELLGRWWVPKSTGMVLLSCEADVRVGGRYRLVFRHDAFPTPMEFFGQYLEVTPPSRLVWTNEEAGGVGPITTVTFEERGETTLLVMRERYPSKEALCTAMTSGEKDCVGESFDQLDELLARRPAEEP